MMRIEKYDIGKDDFCCLSIPDQLDVIYRHGTYLGKVKSLKSHKLLYQLNGFYVEFTYKKYRSLVETISYFETTDRLDDYMKDIDISDFFNSRQPL